MKRIAGTGMTVQMQGEAEAAADRVRVAREWFCTEEDLG